MKVDLKKSIPTYAARRGRFDVVTVPPIRYLIVDGAGDPNTSAAYADALATLYPMAYTVKFLSKNELDRDYVVMPLDALGWADDMRSFTAARDKNRWCWTAMVMLPDWITDEHVDEARVAVERALTNGPAHTHTHTHTRDRTIARLLSVDPYWVLPPRRPNRPLVGELFAPFGPHACEIDVVGALGRFVEFLSCKHPRQPVGAVLAGVRREQVRPVTHCDEADRIHRSPRRCLAACRVVNPQPVPGEDRAPHDVHHVVAHLPSDRLR